jgi:hypothetical protein
MENKFADQYDEMEENILEGVDWKNVSSVTSRLDKLKEVADKSGLWKHKVRSRRTIILLCHELDVLEKMMGELIWLVGMWETNKEDAELEDSMILLERFIDYLPAFEHVNRADIYSAIDVLKDWFATTSREPHCLAWALFKTYKKLGDQQLAQQYLEELKTLEATNPFRFRNPFSGCESCKTARRLQYYASIGFLDKAIKIAEPLLEEDIDYCMTSPRTGLSDVLDALLDADRFADAKKLVPTIVSYIDLPFKAPLRLINPLLRYYLESNELEKAQAIIEEYTPKAHDLADRITANYFFDLVNSSTSKANG